MRRFSGKISHHIVLVHILELSSKVGMAFATAESAIADEVLTSAASVSSRTLQAAED